MYSALIELNKMKQSTIQRQEMHEVQNGAFSDFCRYADACKRKFLFIQWGLKSQKQKNSIINVAYLVQITKKESKS